LQSVQPYSVIILAKKQQFRIEFTIIRRIDRDCCFIAGMKAGYAKSEADSCVFAGI